MKILEDEKLSAKLIKLTKNVCKDVKANIWINESKTETFNCGKGQGLKQGDSLSLLLFTLLMDAITKESRKKSRSRKMFVQSKTNLHFSH